jgi:peptidoglycan DL-endopeptidase CwlO
LSDRDRARHRSPERPVTFLTDAGDAVSGRLTGVGRSSAVLVASTGILATGGVPAQAHGADLAAVTSAPASAQLGLAAPAGLFRSFTSTGTDNGAALTAPMSATVTFESSAFKAEPAVVRPAVAPVRAATTDAGTMAGAATRKTPSAARTAPDEETATAPKPRASQVSAPAERSKPAAAPAKKAAPPKKAPAKKAPAKKSPKPVTRPPAARPAPGAAVRGSSVLAVAARYVVTVYRYGGTTPRGFDCSGFTGYVYRQLGITLPRTANQQLHATRHIPRSKARPGDLVFFVSGSRAYHVGIYAGGGKIYDSPRTGKTIQKRAIWDAAVVFGRVTR